MIAVSEKPKYGVAWKKKAKRVTNATGNPMPFSHFIAIKTSPFGYCSYVKNEQA
ncbi:MAG: hypothetical protein ACO3BD_03050 [Chitinophagaceae bacterium]